MFKDTSVVDVMAVVKIAQLRYAFCSMFYSRIYKGYV